MQFTRFYQPHELKEITPRQLKIAELFVQLQRARFHEGGAIKITTAHAKSLKTSLKTLKNSFPENWYSFDDRGSLCVNLPYEFTHFNYG